MTDHLITVNLVVDAMNGNHAVPAPSNVALTGGDTVRYDTNPASCPFRIVFEDGNPFSSAKTLEISDRSPRTVHQSGTFFCKCFITEGSEPEVGWRDDETPESGGDHDVRP